MYIIEARGAAKSVHSNITAVHLVYKCVYINFQIDPRPKLCDRVIIPYRQIPWKTS